MIISKHELERRIVLYGVSWATYQSLRNAEENYHLRMTFDHGALEIVSPSRKHERISYLLGRMIDQWTLHRKVEIAAGRNTTFSRKDLKSGLEPDNCYWIRHESMMRGKDSVNLLVDPPPDLVIEVDVTKSAVPKLPIYVALGVPEIWHWYQETVQVLRLDSRGAYLPCESSQELPKFPMATAVRLLKARHKKGETALISQFIRNLRSKR